MSTFRRFFSLFVIVSLIGTGSAFAQLVTPVTPAPVYDGRCALNYVDKGLYGWAMADYLCSGNFIGGVQAELSIEYAPTDFSKFAPAPQGYVSASYQAPNIPGYDALYTVGPELPGYLTRAVATIRWETDQFRCYGWGWWSCGRVWESQTVASAWSN